MIGSWSAFPSSEPDEGVEPPAEPFVGDPDGRAQAAEARRGRVEQLADRVEAASQRGPQGRQGVEVVAELAQQRPPVVGEQRAQPGGRVERLADLEELGRFEAAAAGRPFDRRPDVGRRTDPGSRSLLEERARLIGLVESARHDDRVARRLEGLGEASRRREAGRVGQPGPDGRELQQREGTLVQCRARQRAGVTAPDTERFPRSTKRHGRVLHGSPA